MKRTLRTTSMLALMLVLVLSSMTASFASYNFPVTISSSYNHDVDIAVKGSVWWQSGYITITNNSQETLENWKFEFETNQKIKSLENVKYSVNNLSDGTFKYIVSPVSWKQWKVNARWTHKNAIKPGQTIKFKVYGNKSTPLHGLEITNSTLADKDSKVVTITEWQTTKYYQAGDIVYDKGVFYRARKLTVSYYWWPQYSSADWTALGTSLEKIK